MNRRSFIKNTALAATLAGISPSVMASDLKGGKKKKIIFIFRGVSYKDAERAFENFKPTKECAHVLWAYKVSPTDYYPPKIWRGIRFHKWFQMHLLPLTNPH